MQVGTSSLSPITRGTDYAFISIHHREPAYCLVHRFATLFGVRGSVRGLTPKGSVVTGSYRRSGRGLPTALPFDHLLVEWGFAVMSGLSHEVTLMQGSLIYPTRNFATLGIVVTPQCSWLLQRGQVISA